MEQTHSAISVFVVPHGAKFTGPDPSMTPEGRAQIEALKSHLPASQFLQVWRGEGRRHGEVAEILGLSPTHYSALWGPSSSVERRPDGPVTILPDGSTFTFKPADAFAFRASLICLIKAEVANGAIICAGRECLMALTGKSAKELRTGVYRVTVDEDGVTCELIAAAPGEF